MFFFPCLIIGDSIAVGLAEVRPECMHSAQGGINTKNFLETNKVSFCAETVVISLGANDFYNSEIDTEKNLIELRKNVFAKRVFWILPIERLRPKQFEIVKRVASSNGDSLIYRPLDYLTEDGIHPTKKGYEIIKELTE